MTTDILFTTFAKNILQIDLTPAQSVIAKICYDNKFYKNLNKEEKELAITIFGDCITTFGDDANTAKLAQKQIIMRLGRSSGKMLSLDTELPTPGGFIKLIDLKEGDQLFDENGDVCTVTKLHPIDLNPESYRITFDDGTVVDACADHLWLTRTTESKVVSTKQILHTINSNHIIDNCNKTEKRMIRTIEPIASTPMRCITVDSPSHLFLITKSFIPTHNSLLAASYGIYRCFTTDFSRVGPGSTPSYVIVAMRSETAQNTLSVCVGISKESPYISDYIDGKPTKDAIAFRRPTDGRIAQVAVITKSNNGANTRGFDIMDLLIDEAEFITNTASTNDTELLAAARPRVMKGGRIILISTPYLGSTHTGTTFANNYNAPKKALCALAGSRLMRPSPEMEEVYETEMQLDPHNAIREFDCILGAGNSGFFNHEDIERAIDKHITYTGGFSVAGIDLGFAKDSSAIAIVERAEDKLKLTNINLIIPNKQNRQTLSPTSVMSMFLQQSKMMNCKYMCSDQHYFETVRERCNAARIIPIRGPVQTEKSFLLLKQLFREGKISIPNDPELIKQLKLITYTQSQNTAGIKIILPRQGNCHMDIVAALVMAVYCEHKYNVNGNNSLLYRDNYLNNNRHYVPYQGIVGDGNMMKW
jgi:hypothetical protein